jgi:hypothetical protein
MDDDAATAPQASYRTDMASILDTELEMLREICQLEDAAAGKRLAVWLEKHRPHEEAVHLASEMFRVCLIQIMESPTPKREAWIWAMVAGMECGMGVSMGQLGKRFGVRKQAISKAVNDRLDRFGLRRNGYVHSNAYRSIHCQKMLAPVVWQDRRTLGRQPVLKSIESVLARFLGWCNTNNVRKGLAGWDRDRLEHVCASLQPMVDLYHMAQQALAGRGPKHPPMRAEEVLE